MPIAPQLEFAKARLQQMRFAAAEAIVRNYMNLVTDDPDAFNVLGMIYRDWGKLPQSEACLRWAVKARNSGEHYANLGMTLLQQRKWVEGWRCYAERVLPWNRKRAGVVFWTNQPIEGRRILVFHEQGLGDMIQFARFLPELRSRGATVTVRCDEQLRALLDGKREALGIEAVIVDDVPALEYHLQVPQMNLPGLLGVNGTSANLVPYLDVPAGTPVIIPAPAADAPRRIALVWATRSKSGNVSARSCRVEDLAPIYNDPSLACYSLQKDATPDEIAALEALPVHDLREQLVDMAHTASALRSVRALVTVDTAVAHLAGALGVETVLMLHAAADWRWHDDNDRSSWYPTVRIVRQTVPGNWADVVARAHQIIRDLPE